MKVENNLDTDKVRGLVWRLAFPSMLAQFVNVMYSIVDRMYIGNIPEIGALALAGVGICGPVVTLISSFASWIGVGGAPLMSIRLGQKNERAAAQMVANCFALLTGMALIIMIVSYLFKDQLLVFFGAGPAIFPYANQYMKPFNDISGVITELQNALACASRIFAFLEEEPETPSPEKKLETVQGNVKIDHVSFCYTPNKPLIEDFTLDAAPGKRIALVGPTGCGKTTFINLLMRFYDVNSGRISIDGTAVTDVSRHSLRKSFGMVLQDTWIKNGTVRENINIGKPDATDPEIIDAAKMSHSWEFIRRLPNELDTKIREDSLSLGQRQLLCITRVMLCLPPMLILDEATSSIDTRTELLIQEAFDRLMQGRTSFVVAHRLSTIRNADEILVMKDGNIIEQGTHEQLMEKGGFYERLYNSQFVQEEACSE